MAGGPTEMVPEAKVVLADMATRARPPGVHDGQGPGDRGHMHPPCPPGDHGLLGGGTHQGHPGRQRSDGLTGGANIGAHRHDDGYRRA